MSDETEGAVVADCVTTAVDHASDFDADMIARGIIGPLALTAGMTLNVMNGAIGAVAKALEAAHEAGRAASDAEASASNTSLDTLAAAAMAWDEEPGNVALCVALSDACGDLLPQLRLGRHKETTHR